MTEFVDDFIDNSPSYLCIQVIYLRETLTLSIYLNRVPSYPANGRTWGDLHGKFHYQGTKGPWGASPANVAAEYTSALGLHPQVHHWDSSGRFSGHNVLRKDIFQDAF